VIGEQGNNQLFFVTSQISLKTAIMNTPTSQKVALVTGGSRGIGAATCLQLAKAGYAVVVNYTASQAASDKLCQSIILAGGTALGLQADVSDEAQVLAMFAAIDAKFGRLDALVNNAGVVDMTARLDEMSVARWKRMFDINVIGSLICAREAVKRMSTRYGHRGGAIVNLSSAAAKIGSPGQYLDYAASKGAIDTFTLGLAKEVAAEGIRVNGVRPGIIDTDIHASGGLPDRVAQVAPQVPMQRGGSADEVASAITWLLSDAASYVTGTTIDVTGGR
jgi:NAD(P)-dependent dehydrogenase (short-subunit alcohol dehydrogenase family)